MAALIEVLALDLAGEGVVLFFPEVAKADHTWRWYPGHHSLGAGRREPLTASKLESLSCKSCKVLGQTENTRVVTEFQLPSSVLLRGQDLRSHGGDGREDYRRGRFQFDMM